jgi:hypothetical protein
MANKIDFKESGPVDRDSLRIKSNKIVANINVFRFKDADTGQFVCYLPALEISGYGETEAKADEMAKFSVEEFIVYLSKLSPKKRDTELAALGWKHDKLKNKEFSKLVVDVEGELKNFNAAEGTIKRLTLEAA